MRKERREKAGMERGGGKREIERNVRREGRREGGERKGETEGERDEGGGKDGERK